MPLPENNAPQVSPALRAAAGRWWRTLLQLCALWLFALAVRGLFLWEIHETPMWTVLLGDARAYDEWGQRLAEGDWLGEGVFYQAPLYPYFLGVVYSAVGRNPAVVRCVQIVLGASACVLLAVAGSKFFSRRCGMIAGVLLAVYPPAIYFDGLLQKTSLGLFLNCLLLALLGGLQRKPRSPAAWMLSGLVLGLLVLTRENALVLIAPLSLWSVAAFRSFPLKRRLAWSLLFLSGMAVILFPVAARNRYVGGEWHLTTSQFGPNFYIGNRAGASGTYEPLTPNRGDPDFEREDATAIAEQALGRELNSAEVSQFWFARTVEEIEAEPSAWLKLLARKLRLIFHATEIADTEDQYTYADHSIVLAVLSTVWHFGILWPLALFGVFACRRCAARLSLPLLMAIAYAGGVALFYVFARYRLPLVPLLLLPAAAGLARFRFAWRPRMRMRLFAGAVAAVVFGVIANLYGPSRDLMRATMHRNLGVHMAEQNWDFTDVLRQFERSIEFNPDDPYSRLALGDYLLEEKRWSESLAAYRAAYAIDDEVAEAHYGAGLALLELRRPGDAVVEFERAAAIEPDNVAYRIKLGWLLIREQDAARALIHLDAAWQIDVDHPDVQRELGRALLRLGQPRAAIEHLRTALADNPDSIVTRLSLASSYSRLGNHRAAVEQSQQLLKLVAPDSELANFLRRYIDQHDAE